MQIRVRARAVALVTVLGALAIPYAVAGRAAAPQPASTRREIPPLSWTCTMHPEVVEAEKGKCKICGMDLVPVRLDTIWSCPVHSVVQEMQEGKCPICRRELVQVTVAVSWTCNDRPQIDQLNPGTCPGGAPMVPKYTTRAHGNHNPQHGGLFFMAPDNWHHLEGTYPEEGVFRVHLYDDYSKPLPLDQVKQVAGRVVTKEVVDSASRTSSGVKEYPLTLAPSGQYLEARIDRLAVPAEMTVKMIFKPGTPEYRFDFAFPTFSDDRAVVVPTAGVDPSQLAVEIPDDTKQVLAMLSARNQQIREFIARGAFAEMYVPALQSKDLALALDLRVRQLPLRRRPAIASAIKRIVRSAWLLDAYGDQGNRDQISGTYADFADAVTTVETAFGSAR